MSRAAKCDSENNKLKILKIDVYINILHENSCVRKKSKKKISVNFVEFYSIATWTVCTKDGTEVAQIICIYFSMEKYLFIPLR